ncbi:MAG: tRNA preQ1(34) S-adenosylmethionine ribosyltransferase-isomerase QueA [Planctomycetota bacterium]|nr:MAG: tRNA preQ1(34) S-adenosylmethionine ribosyltransferase-isomerase QueA [Planctomycetota bacterium]
MRIDELQYELPPERIAQQPAGRRDASRLLVLDRATGDRQHQQFKQLPKLLPADSLLVFNDTRVLPARLLMHRKSGSRVEGLFLHEPSPGIWEIMLTKSGRLKVGEQLTIDGSSRTLHLLKHIDEGKWHAELIPAGKTHQVLAQCGRAPLPPYIKREDNLSAEQIGYDKERYQTVYGRKSGAIAAPTAGLHFTPDLIQNLDDRGFRMAYVTLHVGVGTFAPIRCDNLADHEMHAEWYECPSSTASAINIAREEGRPIVAVGTTSVRVLESCGDESGLMAAGSGWTRLFIYPPYRFRVVDKMITNFHLPGSTLLAMVFAFAGREMLLPAYEDAIRNQYRFYSYGDAMLIL